MPNNIDISGVRLDTKINVDTGGVGRVNDVKNYPTLVG
jgi:hypothetical protein